MKVLAGIALALVAAGAQATVKFNEFLVNPVGGDQGGEFIELKGAPGESLVGLTLVVIEGGGTTAAAHGTVDQAIALSGNCGSNGLYLIRDSAVVLNPVPEAGTNVLVHDFTPDVENGAQSYYLVRGFTSTVGTDLDVDNDGVLDSVPWTSVDHCLAYGENTTVVLTYVAPFGGNTFPTQADWTPDGFNTWGNLEIVLDASNAAPGPFTFFSDNVIDVNNNIIALPLTWTFTPGSANLSPSQVLVPTAYNITLGTYFGGDLASLAASDDNSLFILNDENGPNARVDFSATGANQPAASFTVKVELSSTRSDLSTFIDAKNYTTNVFVNRDVHTSSTTDVVRTFTVPLDASPVSGTGDVAVQVRWFPNEDLVAEDGWSETVDHVEWTIE